jgi:hypothetical protein
LYILRTVLEDAERDLQIDGTAEAVLQAFEQVRGAAGEVLEAAIEPRAVGAGGERVP